MERELEVIYHTNRWYWGQSIDIIKNDATAMICVKFDEKTAPNVGYICNLSVCNSARRKGAGYYMMLRALSICRRQGVEFARLHVNKKQLWLVDWYKRLGFKELSEDSDELEMIMYLK